MTNEADYNCQIDVCGTEMRFATIWGDRNNQYQIDGHIRESNTFKFVQNTLKLSFYAQTSKGVNLRLTEFVTLENLAQWDLNENTISYYNTTFQNAIEHYRMCMYKHICDEDDTKKQPSLISN